MGYKNNIKEQEAKDFFACPKCEKDKPTKGDGQLFLKAVSVWIKKPHVVNRRLCGSQIVHVSRHSSWTEISTQLDRFRAFYQEKPSVYVSEENGRCFTDLTDEGSDFTVIVRELIPKSEFFPKLLEAVVYDKQNVRVTFMPLAQDCSGEHTSLKPTEELIYKLQLECPQVTSSESSPVNTIKLTWSCDHAEVQQVRRQIMPKWLGTVLLEKLANWSEITDISTAVTSLRLVAVDQYKDTYTRLKNEYGRQLVQNWTERTDPKKFVYEDVAIAAYLLLIWEEERKEKNLSHKQSFVDLGCGNGLLVYILTKEGHKGLGIDLRRRNIWATFGPDIDLKEEAISPSGDHLYPQYDWIIGNHSDELTPWIPVIAARSSYTTSFFVLPCCPHDFVGKFSMAKKGKSHYGSYMDYVKDIIVNCGFVPEADSLRIPSTKRMCFIGKRRTYEQQKELEMDDKRQAFIDKRTLYSSNCSGKNVDKISQKLDRVNQKLDELSQKKDKQHSEVSLAIRDSEDRDSMLKEISTCTERQQQFPTDGMNNSEQSLTRKHDADNEVQNGETDDSLSLASVMSFSLGEKRKLYPDSMDSGFSETFSDASDECFCTKRRKETCEGEDCILENARPGFSLSPSDTSPTNGQSDSPTGETHVKVTQRWVKDFQPRIEPGVRNCQRVPEKVKSHFVQVTFQHVLEAPNATRVSLAGGNTWNKGGSLALSEVAAQFDKSEMQQLKNECGGLQTLLRNHSHIFQVTGGKVQLRDFTASDPWLGRNAKKGRSKPGSEERSRKTTLCWFATHHPDGCPRTKDHCVFAHGAHELRDKRSQEKMGLVF